MVSSLFIRFPSIFRAFRKLVAFVLIPGIGVTLDLCAVDEPIHCLRWQSQIDRFTLQDEIEGTPENAVVCVGSSSMQMWHSRIEEDLAPLTVIKRGFGGSQFCDVIHFFEETIARYQPRAVLLYEGDNDTGNGKSPAVVLRDFAILRAKIEALDPEIRVYVISIKPSILRWDLRERVQATNGLLKAICDADPELTYIDMWNPFLGEEGELSEKWFREDELHLNQEGYDLWAQTIAAVVVPMEAPYEPNSEN